MDLDDQLAALAAGELDEQTARALRARAASDPAVARRLLRLERLEELLRSWEAPAMSESGVARLEERVEAALAELDDEPLRGRADAPLDTTHPRRRRGGERPLAAGGGADGDGGGSGAVLDLEAARARRGLPSWVPAAAVAAALTAVVGTGLVVGGVPGGSDMGDTIAQGDSADAPQEEAAGSAELESSDTATDDSAGTAEHDTAASATGPAAQRYDGVDLDEGELLLLADGDMGQFVDPQGGDGQETRAAAAEACVGVALERDTAPADGREVRLLADGTYAGEPAAFVVVRTPAEPEDRVQVLAYDRDGCSLLAADETTR